MSDLWHTIDNELGTELHQEKLAAIAAAGIRVAHENGRPVVNNYAGACQILGRFDPLEPLRALKRNQLEAERVRRRENVIAPHDLMQVLINGLVAVGRPEDKRTAADKDAIAEVQALGARLGAIDAAALRLEERVGKFSYEALKDADMARQPEWPAERTQ
ncbi:MAG TPA: hypothetical protein VEC14_05280 [Reyranellaceae bacterium]|nr:hypothetical protein [Reyranellaceae bacterium]